MNTKLQEILEKKIKEVEVEIKDNKKWITSLKNEYFKARTRENHQENNISNMIKIANIIIEHNEIILKEYKDMLKEINKIN